MERSGSSLILSILVLKNYSEGRQKNNGCSRRDRRGCGEVSGSCSVPHELGGFGKLTYSVGAVVSFYVQWDDGHLAQKSCLINVSH